MRVSRIQSQTLPVPVPVALPLLLAPAKLLRVHAPVASVAPTGQPCAAFDAPVYGAWRASLPGEGWGGWVGGWDVPLQSDALPPAMARYCSQVCQREAWPDHRAVCRQPAPPPPAEPYPHALTPAPDSPVIRQNIAVFPFYIVSHTVRGAALAHARNDATPRCPASSCSRGM
jgi:hypothetical protein